MEEKRTIGHEFKIVSNLIKRSLAKSCGFDQLRDMTGTHGWVIKYLYDNKDHDVYQRDIENEFSIRRSTVSNILQLMEKNGLIQRISVEKDARLKKLVLTEKAIDLHYQVEASIIQFEKEVQAGISTEEQEIFFRITDKIKENLSHM